MEIDEEAISEYKYVATKRNKLSKYKPIISKKTTNSKKKKLELEENKEGVFDPMEVEYPVCKLEKKKLSRKIKKTSAPSNEFTSSKEREEFILSSNKNINPNAKDADEILEDCAHEHLEKNYCWWCREYNRKKLIIEHEHKKGNAGRYRGVLCRSCNRIEGHIKNMSREEKYDYLYKKIKHKVNKSLSYVKECIDKWYYK